MREVPAKPLPDTLKACHAKIREHVRIINSLRRTSTYLEDKVVELASHPLTILGMHAPEAPPTITKINAGRQ